MENLSEVLRNKRRIERTVKVKISYKGKNVFVEGNAANEFLALEVLSAIQLGFSADSALLLAEEDMILQTVHIKEITKRHDLDRVRSRVIGTQGRTLRTLSNLTNCRLSIKDNIVGIIGDAQEVKDAVDALTSLIQGSKQGNVYSRLEKQRKKKRLLDKVPIGKTETEETNDEESDEGEEE
ncbi:MAG: KH domain-containing protein [Nanoarchaeota archaeon]